MQSGSSSKSWNNESWIGFKGLVGFLSVENEELYHMAISNVTPQEVQAKIKNIEYILQGLKHFAS